VRIQGSESSIWHAAPAQPCISNAPGALPAVSAPARVGTPQTQAGGWHADMAAALQLPTGFGCLLLRELTHCTVTLTRCQELQLTPRRFQMGRASSGCEQAGRQASGRQAGVGWVGRQAGP